MVEAGFFYLFSLIAVVTAVLVITRRSPMISALYLILCFFSLAAIYVLLNAHFIAVIQVLVYAGAIMVLFLFVIMLLNLGEGLKGLGRITVSKVLGLFLALLVLGTSIRYLVDQGIILPGEAALRAGRKYAEFGTIEHFGDILLKQYLLPFEIASVLLLVAIIGAVYMAKKKLD